MRFLFLFFDGVGLGKNDPASNPLVKAKMPNLRNLLGGNQMVLATVPFDGDQASLVAIDPNLGIDGLPQSATGQAALVTGKNVPEIIGEHYGPKPNPPVADVIRKGTIFSALSRMGLTATLLNAYPPRYFQGIESGKHIYSAIPMAVTSAGIPLKDSQDLYVGKALTADFTGEGWREFFKDEKVNVLSPEEAGRQLGSLAASYDFTFFEYWPSDFAGHRQDEVASIELLESFDGVLKGLLKSWDDESGLILLTSDHGNMEDLSTRRHTANPVPALVIGSSELRERFTTKLSTLADIAPAILDLYQ